MRTYHNKNLVGGIDTISIIIYLLLVAIGVVTIYAASYNPENPMIFDISQKYGMQMVWIGVSLVIATIIMLLDSTFFYSIAYPIYIIMVGVLLFVAFFGKEVNGARSWFQLGPISIQPSEFAKFATGLAVAKYVGSYGFNTKKLKDLLICSTIALTPAVAIMLQPDAGSALVFGAFLLVLYREGITKWPYIIIGVVITLFILSFLLEITPLIFIIFTVFTFFDAVTTQDYATRISYWGMTTMLWVILNYILLFSGVEISASLSFLISFAITLPWVLVLLLRTNSKHTVMLLFMFIGSILFLYSVDFFFNNVMKIHQQKRILDLLGLERDVRGWGYNLNQSKIAIGSGGFSGKGFLQGTQTKLNFVPEQSTDFIFCTIGEEWGFVGSSLVIILFTILILRLISMGENQRETFGRVYCYFVAAVLLIHVLVNIGMTIGVLPVIGIPLPFFSYGGSSLMAFTILVFIALKLDSGRKDNMRI